MGLEKNGKLISDCRKLKGYTQKQLADALFVTDKAVSKWERGLSAPDHSLISKLASILDIDVEFLMQNASDIETNWCGLLEIDNKELLYKEKLNGQFLILHMLAYFALLGIKQIEIHCDDEQFIKSLKLEKYGFDVLINNSFNSKKVMKIDGYFFLFGANMTRLLKYMMSSERNTTITIDDCVIPIRLINRDYDKQDFDVKKFGRGYLYKRIDSKKDLLDCENLVKTIQKNLSFKINDLTGIIQNRH